MNNIENLYRQVIMDHYKNPRNKGLKGRLNENTNKLKNFSENLEMSGKYLRVMGRNISKSSPRLGKEVTRVGRIAGKAAGKGEWKIVQRRWRRYRMSRRAVMKPASIRGLFALC